MVYKSEKNSQNTEVLTAVFILKGVDEILKSKTMQCLNPWKHFQVDIEMELQILKYSPSSSYDHFFHLSICYFLLSMTNLTTMICWSQVVLAHETLLKFSTTLVA